MNQSIVDKCFEYYKLAQTLAEKGDVNAATAAIHKIVDIQSSSSQNQDVYKHEILNATDLNDDLIKLILRLLDTELERSFLLDIARVIASFKGNPKISSEKISLLAPTITNSQFLSFDKKCFALKILASIADSESILIEWLRDFCKDSSLDRDLTLLVDLTPHKKDLTYSLGYHKRAKAIKLFRNNIHLKMMSLWRELKGEYPDRLPREKLNEVNNFLFVLSFLPFSESPLRTNSHFKTVIDYAYFLVNQSSSATVNILLTNELSCSSNVLCIPVYSFINSTRAFYKVAQEFYQDFPKDKITFHLVPVQLGDPNLKYARYLLQQVMKLDPHIVLFFGGKFSSISLPEICYQNYPTIYMQFNVNNKPNFNFDIYIPHGNIDSFDGFINPERWTKHKRLFMPFPKKMKYSYRRVKPFKESIAIVTVGNKLEEKIKDDNYIERMLEVLRCHSKVCWLLIGVKNVKEFLLRSNALQEEHQKGRVNFINFEPDLRAVYEHCDIYAYPKQSGGGGGTFLAATEALPIVCYKGNDIESTFLDAPVKFFMSDDRYFNYLENLIVDRALRKAEGEQLKSLLSNSYPYSCIEDFISLCYKAQKRFYLRKQNLIGDR